MVMLCTLCVVRADADALSAIDTALAHDDRFAAAHANGFRWAALDAVCAAYALAFIERDRVEKNTQSNAPPPLSYAEPTIFRSARNHPF